MLKIAQYPRNADGTPMDIEVGVMTDATGNGGARLTTPPVGPDNAPIDAKALVIVDTNGNPVIFPTNIGVVADSDAAGSVGTDNRAAINAAILAAYNAGGGEVKVPRGYYKVSGYVTMMPHVKLKGEGIAATFIVGAYAGVGGGVDLGENTRNDSLLVMWSPINSSTPIYVSVEDIHLRLSNAASIGACYYDRGGTQWNLTRVGCQGGKWGVLADQSELADIDLCDIGAQNGGGAGVWIVNGSDLTTGAAAGFSNRISVKRSQLNQGAAAYGIVDDGGYVHSFEDNNYNGCLNHIRVCNVTPLSIRGGEYESAASHCILISSLTLVGNSAGGSLTSIYGGSFSQTSGHSAIQGFGAPGQLNITGLAFFANGAGANPISGTANFTLVELLSYDNTTGVAVADGIGQYVHIDLCGSSGAYFNGAIFGILNGAGANGGGLVAPNVTSVGAATLENGGDSGTADSSKALQYYGYNGTNQYRHALVSKHNTTLTGNGLEWWLHHGVNDGVNAIPSVRAMTLDARDGLKVFDRVVPQIIGQSAVAASHTGDTAEATLATITIPAGALGANGQVVIEALYSVPNNANTKTARIKFGGTTIVAAAGTTIAAMNLRTRGANRNAPNSQIFSVLTAAFGTSSQANQAAAVDTSAAVNITLTAQCGVNTDTITLESYIVTIYPKA